jgi:GNAT superfamily N-acetyltransferase
MDKAHPKDEHYYLAFLGIRRSAQGTGLGSALLSSMIERCDAEGVPAYLENSNPRNTALYARHGFEERDYLAVPKGCPPLLGMWREAKP